MSFQSTYTVLSVLSMNEKATLNDLSSDSFSNLIKITNCVGESIEVQLQYQIYNLIPGMYLDWKQNWISLNFQVQDEKICPITDCHSFFLSSLRIKM